MKEFVLTYWKDILSAVVLVASVVIWFFKRRTYTSFDSEIISDLFVLLTGWIKDVESPGDGASKKEKVTNKSLRYVAKRYGRQLTDDEMSVWTKRVSFAIEMILATPQKKEKIANEK